MPGRPGAERRQSHAGQRFAGTNRGPSKARRRIREDRHRAILNALKNSKVRKLDPDHITSVRCEGISIGEGGFTVVAGPCAVESEEQTLAVAKAVEKAGAKIFRASLFKPRTSPHSFQGVGAEGIPILAAIKRETSLMVETEVLSPIHLDLLIDHVDMLRIGSRSMRSYELLKEVGRTRKPVILKRGMSATLEELLLAAEYILTEGNEQVVLCERGIRTFETYTRNTLDILAVPALKELTHLPVIVDPSHAAGERSLVAPLAHAAAAVGAHGIMVEIHPDPDSALSDGPQSLELDQFGRLMESLGIK
ncbi:MAG: 3-deoxy-7-phosphoheptulonate synthase [Gemmatimonadetes bacterium]|nr:3-deoxy-7-phosphoheptulonate synthase [Gemmatimonadota bacterium]